MHVGRLPRIAGALIAVASLVGMALQYRDYVIGKSGWAVVWSSIDFVSLFTIDGNILVTVVVGVFALGSYRLIIRPAVAGAACLYIIVAGTTYFLLLSMVYHPEGLTLVDLLHYVVPPAYLLFWLMFVPKGALRVSDVARWLVFPVAYVGYTLARGSVVGWYPYPFLDAAALGYAMVLRTVALLIIGFSFVGTLLIVALGSARLELAAALPR